MDIWFGSVRFWLNKPGSAKTVWAGVLAFCAAAEDRETVDSLVENFLKKEYREVNNITHEQLVKVGSEEKEKTPRIIEWGGGTAPYEELKSIKTTILAIWDTKR